MNEKIIEMARQAKLPYYWREDLPCNLEQLEVFAKLVAAKERDAIKDICKAEQGPDSADIWNICAQSILEKINQRYEL